MSVKDQVLQAIHRLPDDADYRDVTQEVALLAALREAEEDIVAGWLVTNEQKGAHRLMDRRVVWTERASSVSEPVCLLNSP